MGDAAQVSRSSWQVPTYDTLLWRGKTQPHCVIIPVINEGPRIRALLSRMAGLSIAEAADIVIVDGGSTDGSLDAAPILALGVRGILRKTGPGALGAQLRCAYAFACAQGYEGIITIDGNDKDDPEAIPRFIDALREGVDMVQASRFVPGGTHANTPWLRMLAIRALHAPLLSMASGFRWTDTTQGFRAYRTAVLEDPRVAPFRDIFTGYELLAYLSYRVPRLGYRCRELPSNRSYPPRGPTPTKISVRGYLPLLWGLIRSCTGRLNPP